MHDFSKRYVTLDSVKPPHVYDFEKNLLWCSIFQESGRLREVYETIDVLNTHHSDNLFNNLNLNWRLPSVVEIIEFIVNFSINSLITSSDAFQSLAPALVVVPDTFQRFWTNESIDFTAYTGILVVERSVAHSLCSIMLCTSNEIHQNSLILNDNPFNNKDENLIKQKLKEVEFF